MDVLGELERRAGRVNEIALEQLDKSFGRVNSTVFRQVNRVVPWFALPRVPGLLNLRALRDDLRELNLYDTDALDPDPTADDVDPATLPPYRTYDGSLQDP